MSYQKSEKFDFGSLQYMLRYEFMSRAIKLKYLLLFYEEFGEKLGKDFHSKIPFRIFTELNFFDSSWMDVDEGMMKEKCRKLGTIWKEYEREYRLVPTTSDLHRKYKNLFGSDMFTCFFNFVTNFCKNLELENQIRFFEKLYLKRKINYRKTLFGDFVFDNSNETLYNAALLFELARGFLQSVQIPYQGNQDKILEPLLELMKHKIDEKDIKELTWFEIENENQMLFEDADLTILAFKLYSRNTRSGMEQDNIILTMNQVENKNEKENDKEKENEKEKNENENKDLSKNEDNKDKEGEELSGNKDEDNQQNKSEIFENEGSNEKSEQKEESFEDLEVQMRPKIIEKGSGMSKTYKLDPPLKLKIMSNEKILKYEFRVVWESAGIEDDHFKGILCPIKLNLEDIERGHFWVDIPLIEYVNDMWIPRAMLCLRMKID